MKKLLLITQGFPYGESEQMFLRTEFELLAREFQVSVLSLNRGEPLLHTFDELEYKSYLYQELSFSSPKDKSLFFIKNIAISHEVLQDISMAIKHVRLKCALKRIKSILFYSAMANEIKKQIKEIVKNDEIDLIYTYWCTHATVAALRVKKTFKDIPVITRFHGYDLYQERIPDTKWQCLRTYITQNCDKLIFACKYGEEYYLDHWGANCIEKCAVSYLGCQQIGAPQKKYTSDSLKVVSCSNLIQLKRIDLIIDALALIPNHICIEWYHLGDGQEFTSLHKRASEKLDLKNNISWSFKGHIPHNKLHEVYSEIQPEVFLTVSETEGGAPVSIQESFSMGVPAIGTKVGGIPDLIEDGETGFLLSANPTAQEIATALVTFNDLSTIEKDIMSKKALDLWAEHFDAYKNAQKMIESLNDIL